LAWSRKRPERLRCSTSLFLFLFGRSIPFQGVGTETFSALHYRTKQRWPCLARRSLFLCSYSVSFTVNKYVVFLLT
jgi:hypothetical protein